MDTINLVTYDCCQQVGGSQSYHSAVITSNVFISTSLWTRLAVTYCQECYFISAYVNVDQMNELMAGLHNYQPPAGGGDGAHNEPPGQPIVGRGV